MTKRILIAEDDTRLAKLIVDYLKQNGFEVFWEADGNRVQAAVKRHEPDLLILDVMLPNRDGFDLCRAMRTSFRGPILMFTARESDIDQVLGLELGADDYVVKPVEPRVLLARVNALLRRSGGLGADDKQTLTFGQLSLNARSQTASLSGETLSLTSHEFELLWYLGERAGSVVTRESIHRDVIGREYDGLDRTVDMRVSHLRKKVGDDHKQPERLKTVWGKGYLFVPDAWE
ncbi:response regulator transcription factor [Aliidiomarina sanyensis]|uniref:DNA-binding response regulator n=1 Tax=Aliidiomarina sanyensis TaxID=1249555 RepID=A0A432WBY7_9GAMM|nr:response regulator transcription factor [Aliidiomarina sanyensis]RUO29505.1 DNA-binding response regulator [Aliidiomarina sanyensis]